MPSAEEWERVGEKDESGGDEGLMLREVCSLNGLEHDRESREAIVCCEDVEVAL
jgi:hypothetical protein